ncbi:type III PLP-dependent enzyme domain-containing protein, partial [Marinilabilia sp.]
MSIDINKVPTPTYVMDESLLRRNLELIKSVRDRAGIEIILAFKAFSLWPAFPIVREYIPGATASSIHEARLAFEEMGSPAHTYSPAYTEKDFPGIMKFSSHITFNSLAQYERFKPMLESHDKHISPGLRINPEYSEVSTDLYNPCSPGSRLGILTEQMPTQLPEGIEGLHFHALCESSSTELEKILQNVEEKFGNQLRQIKWLNMGGGHLMTRKDYDVEHLIKILKDFKKDKKPAVLVMT